jgi:serine/threonine protein kinase
MFESDPKGSAPSVSLSVAQGSSSSAHCFVCMLKLSLESSVCKNFTSVYFFLCYCHVRSSCSAFCFSDELNLATDVASHLAAYPFVDGSSESYVCGVDKADTISSSTRVSGRIRLSATNHDVIHRASHLAAYPFVDGSSELYVRGIDKVDTISSSARVSGQIQLSATNHNITHRDIKPDNLLMVCISKRGNQVDISTSRFRVSWVCLDILPGTHSLTCRSPQLQF